MNVTPSLLDFEKDELFLTKFRAKDNKIILIWLMRIALA